MYVNVYIIVYVYTVCVFVCAVDYHTYEQISEWTGDMLIFRCTRTHVHVCKYVCIYTYVYCVCGCVCGGSLHLWTKSLSVLVISLYSYIHAYVHIYVNMCVYICVYCLCVCVCGASLFL